MTKPVEAIFNPQAIPDPYPAYAQLRERAPVTPVLFPNGLTLWMVTRYQEACAALNDNRLGKNPEPVRHLLREAGSVYFSDEGKSLNAHMLTADPPEHTRLRKPVSREFSPRHVAELRPHVESVIDGLLNAMEGRKECDLIEAFAFPLPLAVVCEVLGVPEEDKLAIKVWSTAIFGPESASGPDLNPTTALALLRDYLTKLIATKRALLDQGVIDPGLISRLLATDDAVLSAQELLSTVYLLLMTGHTSTTDLIGNALATLLRHPDQLALLRQRPDLIDSAVEELLRFETSVVRATLRLAHTDIEIGDRVIPAGSMVTIALGAANRDPRCFEEPDRLDITRTNNQHLSFGGGVHYCLGAAMSRMIIGSALSRLLARFPDLALAVAGEDLPWQDPEGGIGRRLESLPVLLSGDAMGDVPPSCNHGPLS